MTEEYISREAALEITTRTCGDYAAAFAEIRKLPAADVVEVVRCRECDAWKKAMSILDKKYAEAKKLPFIRDPLAWALYHTWKEFDDGKRCD